jgi:prepilin-type N-terminal cleavage/methylation domain-containing protein
MNRESGIGNRKIRRGAAVSYPIPDTRYPIPLRHSGVTLLELLLVLALLVVFAAMAWPSLQKPFDNQRLRKAGDQIRAEWGKARVKAMDTGLVHVFTYDSATGAYQLQPWAGFDAALEGNSGSLAIATTSLDLLSSATEPMIGGQQLPEGVSFSNLETVSDTRSAVALSSADTSLSGGTAQMRGQQEAITPILFYPDGTTSTARLTLANAHQRYVILELRGLTGVVKVSEVLSAEEIQ